MRKMMLIIMSVQLFGGSLHAQQPPRYTQYILNNYIINPAITGIENYTDIKFSHRHQWVGLQDAPVTTYFTAHTALGKKDDRITATSFDMPGENPRGRNYWQNYTAASPHHGIGVKIVSDKTGPLSRFEGYLSYAYHLGISAQTSIAAGFEGGVRRISLNSSELDFGQANPVDPAVAGNSDINRLKPDLGLGIWVYSADYFMGLSAQQMLPQKIYFSDNELKSAGSASVPHVFFTGGVRFFVNEDITALPSIMLQYVRPMPLQAGVNIKFQYHDLLWAGGGYRFKDGVSGFTGMNISNTFNVSYAYDYTSSRLGSVSKGTHELLLGIILGNKYDDGCPRNIW